MVSDNFGHVYSQLNGPSVPEHKFPSYPNAQYLSLRKLCDNLKTKILILVYKIWDKAMATTGKASRLPMALWVSWMDW